jgi:hypothetical protein
VAPLRGWTTWTMRWRSLSVRVTHGVTHETVDELRGV